MSSTPTLKEALRKRHDPQAYALMFEVADGTGAAQRRWADAVAMGLWPSRGLNIEGYELKASRTDWLKELKTPEKAEAICQYCDYWWLAVTDPKIVKDGELPANWGLLALNKKGVLVTVKPAPKLTPLPLTREFLAAMLRSAAKPAVKDDQMAMLRAREEGRVAEAERSQRVIDKLNQKIQELDSAIVDFQRTSGITIKSPWSYGRPAAQVGQTVRDVLDGKHDRDRDELRQIRSTALSILNRIDKSGLLDFSLKAETAPQENDEWHSQ